MSVAVEEAAEGELVEGVLGVLPVAEQRRQRVVVVVLAVHAPQFVRVHGVEVGGVRGVGDGGNVGRHLLPEVTGEVDGPEEGVGFDFVGAVCAEAVVGAAAQFDDEIGRLGAELGLGGDVQRALPVDHLQTQRHRRKRSASSPRFTAAASHTFI